MYTHQNPIKTWLLLFLRVWGSAACPDLSPSSQMHTHVCTQTSEPRDCVHLVPWTLLDVQICPSAPAPKAHAHTKIHIYARTHTLLHMEAHDSMAFPVITCWRCRTSSSLLPPPKRTACWNCWDCGSQLVWSCSFTAWRRSSINHESTALSCFGSPWGVGLEVTLNPD